MSRHVLTNVLLDFGNSLWRSDAVHDELPGLARSGFDAVGQFGIGFYAVFMLGSQVRVTTRRFERSERDDANQWLLNFEDGLQGRPMLTRAPGKDRLPHNGTRVSVKLDAERLARMFVPMDANLRFLFAQLKSSRPDTVVPEGSKLLSALVGWLCPASEVALHVRFADAPTVAVVGPNDWMHLEQESLTRRVGCENRRLVPLRDESGALIGRVGLEINSLPGALVLHGVRCGGMPELLYGGVPELVGLVLASENNREARRFETSVAGSTAAWSEWAAQLLDGLPNQYDTYTLVKLHPLPRRPQPAGVVLWRVPYDAG